MSCLFSKKEDIDIPAAECIFDAYGNIVRADEALFSIFDIKKEDLPFSFIKYIKGEKLRHFWHMLELEKNDLVFQINDDSKFKMIYVHMRDRRNGFIIDISNVRKKIVDLETTKKQYQAIINSTVNMIFINDTVNKRLKVIDNKGKAMISDTDFDEFKINSIEKERIHPDDIEDFLQLCAAVAKGVEDFSYKIRSNIFTTGFIDYSVIGKAMFDESGNSTYIVGTIKKLDVSRDDHIGFNNASCLDSLTKVLNKESMKDFIIREVSKKSSEHFAVMIIDIDDFKKINDTYGHLFGDTLLVEFTKLLKKRFKSRGTVGRIGGDEFCILLTDCNTRERMTSAGREIRHIIEVIYSGQIKAFNSSCTIGISQYPEDGQDYETLYSNADKALYYGKRKGKNCHTLFVDIKNEKITKGETVDKVLAKMISSSNNVFISCVIESLMHTVDYDNAINIAFAMIGNRYLLDRILLYKRDDNNNQMLKHKWGNYESAPKVAIYASDDNYREYFNNDNIFSVYNTSNLLENNYLLYVSAKQSGTKSIVQYCIQKNDKVDGIISFEMISYKRAWQNYELDCFIIVSRIISSMLIRRN